LIRVENLTVHAGRFQLSGVSFEIPTGEYAVLMGKTGCGKTTLLEAICGLKHVSGGRIELMGREVTRLKPASRGIGFVPQEGALFPTMTVRDHLAFALTIRRAANSLIEERVGLLSDMLGIGHLLARKPQGLSGGERQRVVLGRALSFQPKILCLDEPLSALDDDTRDEMYELLKSIQEKTGVTTLHVTHSQESARRLANRTLVLNGGVITAQSG
jgi:ABC-type sugar transport system ATPase subunit